MGSNDEKKKNYKRKTKFQLRYGDQCLIPTWYTSYNK